MDELVNQVVQKTGISQDQARQAVQVVLGYVKNKVPGPVASQVDNVIGGQSGSSRPNPGDMGNPMGGMFGGNS